jgi:hypothetical protein
MLLLPLPLLLSCKTMLLMQGCRLGMPRWLLCLLAATWAAAD